MLKFLVEEECDINAKDRYGWTVLHSAASGIAERGGGWQTMKWLLQCGANADAKTETDFEIKDVLAKTDYSLVEDYKKLVDKYSSFQSSTVSIKK